MHLGFREDVEADVVAGWVERQDRDAMLAALNELRVVPGDRVYVPAGLPHAIGEGILLVELQEPADLSVLLEWAGFELDGRREGHLGLGFDVALRCLTRSALERSARAPEGRRRRPARARPGVTTLLPPEADAYFRAERLRPSPSAALEPGFSILVAVAGRGRLDTESGGELELARGDTVLVPYAAGGAELTGEIEVLRCLPPSPEA